MTTATPLICHECWPKKQNHTGPCEHALFVYRVGHSAGQWEMRERAAVEAWRLGMDYHPKVYDSREMASLIARYIRAIDIMEPS